MSQERTDRTIRREFPVRSATRTYAIISCVFWSLFLIFWIFIALDGSGPPGAWVVGWLLLSGFALGFEILRLRSYRQARAWADQTSLSLTRMMGPPHRIPWTGLRSAHLDGRRTPRLLYLVFQEEAETSRRAIVPLKELEDPMGLLRVIQILGEGASLDPRLRELAGEGTGLDGGGPGKE